MCDENIIKKSLKNKNYHINHTFFPNGSFYYRINYNFPKPTLNNNIYLKQKTYNNNDKSLKEKM